MDKFVDASPNDVHAIEFEAELRQIKSMADHSYNVVINVPEYFLPMVQTMMAWLGDQIKIVMVDA